MDVLMAGERLDLFDRMFSPRTRHELVADAETALKTANLPKRLEQKVLAAYGECISVKDKAPTLRVDLLQKEPKPARTHAKKAVQA